MIHGTVKWYRSDGTGYIQDRNGTTYYTDRSVVLCDDALLIMGTPVSFKRNFILGKLVATNVNVTHTGD